MRRGSGKASGEVKRGEDEEKQGKRDEGEAEAEAGAGTRGGRAWPAWVGG